jgi:uncharacterized protein involved in exopolysaccharide biosynthesis
MIQDELQKEVVDDRTDLRHLFSVIWQGKWLIIVTTAIFAIASVIFALSLPNIYKSEALLAPAAEQKGASLSGQLGGLAALAGVNLGGGAAIDQTALALEVVKSRDFIGRFISNHLILADLMASESWDMSSNTIIYDTDIYHPDTMQWVRNVKPPRQAKPSIQEAYKVFFDLLEVKRDEATGMVKLSIEHVSPYVAQNWLSLLISELNREIKLRDIEEAERSILYLKAQIAQTNVADLKAAFFALIEEQTQKLMLANVREEYVFKIVDPAIIPEEKSKPARAFICIFLTTFGFIFSSSVVVIRRY